MSLVTRRAARMYDLPPAVSSKIDADVDLRVPMPDGAVLYASRFYPRGGDSLPIVLIRTPYSPRGNKPDVLSRLIAERGYQVVVQNCRGRFGSEGEFEPFQTDRNDGLATLAWMADQPWFSGAVAMFGLSYFGWAQLAAGPGAPAYLKALVPQMASSRIYDTFRPRGTLALTTTLFWHYSTYAAGDTTWQGYLSRLRRGKALRAGAAHLPIGEADRVATGKTISFYQQAIRADRPDDPLWAKMDHSKLVADIDAPVCFVTGWYDFFLGRELADYRALHEAGKNPYLTVGPWPHFSSSGLKAGFQESFAWYDAHLRGNPAALRAEPVRVFVMGAGRWADLPSWPPPGERVVRFLQAGGHLSNEVPAAVVAPSQYRYDPADPTPSVGGAVPVGGGPKDNRALEARADVLTFTSEPMGVATTVMGPVTAELYVRSSLENTDFTARLCDVTPKGKSINICDGIARLDSSVRPDGDGVHHLIVDLGATAFCFKPSLRDLLLRDCGC
jgi:uncharacterized protein